MDLNQYDLSRRTSGRERSCKNEVDVMKSLKHPKNVVNTKTVENLGINPPTYEQLQASIGSHFGTSNRLAEGHKLKILGRRVSPDNKVEYLIQWH